MNMEENTCPMKRQSPAPDKFPVKRSRMLPPDWSQQQDIRKKRKAVSFDEATITEKSTSLKRGRASKPILFPPPSLTATSDDKPNKIVKSELNEEVESCQKIENSVESVDSTLTGSNEASIESSPSNNEVKNKSSICATLTNIYYEPLAKSFVSPATKILGRNLVIETRRFRPETCPDGFIGTASTKYDYELCVQENFGSFDDDDDNQDTSRPNSILKNKYDTIRRVVCREFEVELSSKKRMSNFSDGLLEIGGEEFLRTNAEITSNDSARQERDDELPCQSDRCRFTSLVLPPKPHSEGKEKDSNSNGNSVKFTNEHTQQVSKKPPQSNGRGRIPRGRQLRGTANQRKYFKAVRELAEAYCDELPHPMKPLRGPSILDWTPLEVVKFQFSIFVHDKRFQLVANDVGTKTAKECVQFYYLWKCSSRYKQFKSERKAKRQALYERSKK